MKNRMFRQVLILILASLGWTTLADVQFSPTSRSFGAEGGFFKIPVSATAGTVGYGTDRNHWVANPMVNWIKVKAVAGPFVGHEGGSLDDSIEYTVAENLSGATRVGVIRVDPGAKYYTVVQSGEFAKISHDSFFFTSEGGERRVQIGLLNDEYQWTASCDQDFVLPSGTNGYGSTELVVRVAKNDSVHARTYRTAKLVICGREFEVIQTAQTIVVSPAVAQCDPNGEVVAVDVFPFSGLNNAERIAARYDWRASSDCDWLKVPGEPVRTGRQTIKVAVSSNDCGVTRTGVLRFERVPNASGPNTIYDEVTEMTFVQRSAGTVDFTVSPASVSVGSEGGSGSASVVSVPETDWQAESSCDWLEVTEGVSEGNGSFSWKVGKNVGCEPRTATVRIRVGQAEDASSDAEVTTGLDLWITDDRTLEGNSTRVFEKPLSQRFDGTFENALTGCAFPRHASSAFTFAFTFESSACGCTNALLRLGNRFGMFVDSENRLVVQLSRDGKSAVETIRTDFVLPWRECGYTVVVRQDEAGRVAVFGAQKGAMLAKQAEFACDKILPFDDADVPASQIVLGSSLDKSLGKMDEGRVQDVRLWSRGLSDVECGYVDILKVVVRHAVPTRDAELPRCSYFPLDGNLLGSLDGSVLNGYGSTLSHTNSLIGVPNRMGAGDRAARAANRYYLDRFSDLFAGHCITNDNKRWPSEGICVSPGRSSSGSSYGGTGSGSGYFCRHGYNSDDYFPYPMVATGECETNATYAVWVRVDAYPSAGTKELDILARRRPTSDARGFLLDRDNEIIKLSLDGAGFIKLSGSGISERMSAMKLPRGVWCQLVLVGRARESVALYVDGVKWLETPSTMTLGYLPPVDRRCYCWGSDNPEHGAIEHAVFSVGEFEGAVDDLAFYHDALTAEQVRILYEKTVRNAAGSIGAGLLTVTQAAAPLTLSETDVSVDADGGRREIAVSTADYVRWEVLSDAEWVFVAENASGSGSARVGLDVAANEGSESRTAVVTIAGQKVKVVQAGRPANVEFSISEIGCDVNVWPVSVQVDPKTSWWASSNADWLRVSQESGVGSQTVILRADANPGFARTAKVTIAGKKFTVTQAAHWVVLDPLSCEHECLATQGVVSVTVPQNCEWTAKSSASWLVLRTKSGTGPGQVDFALMGNASGADRVGTITVGDRTVTVTQLVTRVLSPPHVIGKGFVSGTLGDRYGMASDLLGHAYSGWYLDHWEYVYRDTASGLVTTANITNTLWMTVKVNEYERLTAYFAPQKVSNVKVENVSCALRLSWSPVPVAVKYRIYRSAGSVRPQEALDEITGSSFEDGSGVLDTAYNYWIETVAEDGSTSVEGPISATRQHVELDVPMISGPRIVYAGETRDFRAGKLWTDGCFHPLKKLAQSSEYFSLLDWNAYVQHNCPWGMSSPACTLAAYDWATGCVVRLNLTLKAGTRDVSSVLPVTIVPQYSTDGVGTLLFDMRLESVEQGSDAFVAMTNGVEVVRVRGGDGTRTVAIECCTPGTRTFSWKTVTTACAPYGEVSNLLWMPAPDEVTLTFDAQGGVCETASMVGVPGQPVGTLPHPVRTGYTFDGWYRETAEGGGSVTAASRVPPRSCVLVAHWSPAMHEVTFDLGDHAERVAGGALTQRVKYGTAAIAPTLRLQEGYAFDGWSADFASVTGRLTVVAAYRPIVYTLSYSETRGAANANPVSYTVEDAVEFAPLADVPGWMFLGWSPFGLSRGTAGDRTISAQWTPVMCRVGSSDGSSREFTWGETVTLSCDSCVTNGWTNLVCTGWVGTGDVPASGATFSVTFTARNGGTIRWLYATNYWFAASAGEGGNVSRAEGPDGLDLTGCWVPAGTRVSLAATADDTHHFRRWNNAADGSSASEAVWSGVMVAPAVLSAVFSDTWAVTFDLGVQGAWAGGGNLYQEIPSGGAATAPAFQTAAGYEFTGWSGAFDEIEADVLVRAQYKPIAYAVDYVGTMGCANTNPLSYTVEDAVSFSALTNPPGWRFSGWEPAFIEKGETGDRTVTAQWERLKYAVDLDGVVDGACVYGQEVTAVTSASVTNGQTNVVCRGWIGTGDVPTRGTGTQVTFVVTQPSTLRWLYETNFFASVTTDGHGRVTVKDADGLDGPCSGWRVYGTEWTLTAAADSGYEFLQWTDVETGRTLGTSSDLRLTLDRPLIVRADFSPISYVVRIHAGAGVGSADDQLVAYGAEAVVSPGTLSREGYRLAGWTTDPQGSEVQYAAGEAVSNLTNQAGMRVDLYAVWVPLSYRVRFLSGLEGTTGEMPDQVFTYDETQRLASNAYSRANFVFCGWQASNGRWWFPETLEDGALLTNPGWSTLVNDQLQQADANFCLELEGVWKRVFTFDKDGGTGGTDSISVSVGESFPEIELPTKPGYFFGGYKWSVDNMYAYSGNGSTWRVCTENIFFWDQVLVAVWAKDERQYYIDYDLGEGGAGNGGNPDRYCTWDEVVLKDPVANEGYRFAGWSPTNCVPRFSVGNRAFTAQWIKLDSVKVTYDLHCEDAYYRYVFQTYDRVVEETCWEGDLVGLIAPSRTGYTFAGWFTEPEGGVRISDDFEATVDVTLHARWIPIAYVVRFDANGGEGTMDDQDFVYGEIQDLHSNRFEKVGSTFYGWVYQNQNTGLRNYVDDGASVSNLTDVADAVVTLKAVWSSSDYTFSFHANGARTHQIYDDRGNCILDPSTECVTVTYASSRAIGSVWDWFYPYPSGAYTFSGWALRPDGVAVVTNCCSVMDVVAKTGGDADLYAVWKPISYVVTFDGNGGKGSMAPIEMTYGVEYRLPGCTFEMEGMEIGGWYLHLYGSDGIAGCYSDGAIVSNLVWSLSQGGVAAQPRLSAWWRKKTYAVEIDGAEARYECGSEVTLRAPEKAGYICTGWTNGTGDIPEVGTTDSVSFLVTQSSALRWRYAKVCRIEVCSSVLSDSDTVSQSRIEAAKMLSVPFVDGVSPATVVQSYGDYSDHYVYMVPSGSVVCVVTQAGYAQQHGFAFSSWRSLDFPWGEIAEEDGVRFECNSDNGERMLVFEDISRDWSICASYDEIVPVVTFDFGEHGKWNGKGGQSLQTPGWMGSATAPGVLADSAYKFIGWNAPFDRVVSNVTVVAQYEKIAAVVSGRVVSGCDSMGSVSGSSTVKTGSKATLKAIAAKTCVFAGWYEDSSGIVPASGDYLVANRTIVSAGEDVTLFAKFIPQSSDRAEVSFVLSDEITNGVTLVRAAIDVSGCASLPTVKVSGLPSGLKFTSKDIVDSKSKLVTVPANTIYGTPTKSGVYAISATVTTAGKKTAECLRTVVVRKSGENVVKAEVVLVDECRKVISAAAIPGKVTGSGVYASGKKVTLKATAGKGYVFAGWYSGKTLKASAANHSLTMGSEDVVLTAAFVTADVDRDSVDARVNGMSFPRAAETSARFLPIETNAYVGAYVEWTVESCALSATSVKVSGLPSGLKFTSKDIVDSKTKTVTVPANTIYGTLTAASKTDKNGSVTPSKVIVSVTTAGKNTQLFSVDFTVFPLPTACVGTFEGFALADVNTNATPSASDACGWCSLPCPFTATVDSKGALSGSLTVLGKKLSFKSTGYSSFDSVASRATYDVSIPLKSIDKTWGEYLGLSLSFSGGLGWLGAVTAAGPHLGITSVDLFRNAAKDAVFIARAKSFAGVYVAAFDVPMPSGVSTGLVTVALTVDQKGVAKAAGTFVDASTFSASRAVVPDADGTTANVLIPVTGRSFGSGCLLLSFVLRKCEADGTVSIEPSIDCDGFSVSHAATYMSKTSKAEASYAYYALLGSAAYAYSVNAWIPPTLSRNDQLRIAYDDGQSVVEALFAFLASKTGVVTGVGKTTNKSSLTFKIDAKTGLFAGTNAKAKIFGALYPADGLDFSSIGKGIVVLPSGAVRPVSIEVVTGE